MAVEVKEGHKNREAPPVDEARRATKMAVVGLVSDGVIAVVIYWPLVRQWLAQNRGPLEVITGGVIAIFTVALWRSTDKLWASGADTLKEMEAQRQVMANQQEALSAVVDIYHRMLVATHPPSLALVDARPLSTGLGQRLSVRSFLENRGATTATVRRTIVYDNLPSRDVASPLNRLYDPQGRAVDGRVIGAGERVECIHGCPAITTDDLVAADQPVLELRGLIIYGDETAAVHALDFLLRYNRLDGCFQTVPDGQWSRNRVDTTIMTSERRR